MEGLTFFVWVIRFLRVKLLETKLESNEETRAESYGEIKLESREQSYRGTNLENKEKN